jgi:hypothetical protein
MKILILLAITLLNMQAFAAVDLSCKSDSKMAEAELIVTLTSIKNNILLTVTGGSTPMTEVVSSIVTEDMSNISSLLSCSDLDEEAQEICAYEYAVKNNALESRIYLDVQMMQIYETEAMGSFSFDKTKIDSAIRYNVGESSKFGQVGVTVFSDKDGNTIGKLFNMIEVMDCK